LHSRREKYESRAMSKLRSTTYYIFLVSKVGLLCVTSSFFVFPLYAVDIV
jgi:hypothetical protein